MKKYIPIFIFFLLVFFAGWMQHDDADIYGHFTIGKVIAEQGRIITHEIVSNAGQGREYIPIEWLFQLILYWFLDTFGFASFHAFTAIFTVIQVGAVYFLLRKVLNVNQIFSIILSSSYLLLNYQFLVARPQIIADTFIILTIIILFTYLLKNKNYLYLLIPIMYVWANLHPSVIIGILLCIGYCFVCLLQGINKNRQEWMRKSKMLGVYSVILIGVTTILPPQYLNVYKDLLLMYHNNYIMSVVNLEWLPLLRVPTLATFYILTTTIFVLTFLFIVIRRNLLKQTIFLLPLLIFIPYAFTAARNIYFGHLATIICIGWALTSLAISSLSKKQKYIFATFTFVFLGITVWIAINDYQESIHISPEKAVDFILKENLQGKMFNQFSYGNYLEYRLYPSKKVFMDGRAEPFFCCEMPDWYRLQINSSNSVTKYKKVFDSFFNKYQFSYAILGTQNNPSGIVISNMLEKNPLWFLVYKDNISEIWVKADGENASLLKKLTTNQIQQQSTSDTKIFSSDGMNLTFSYPKNLKISQINPQLIAIASPSDMSPESSLFMYSTFIPKDSTSFSQPFQVPPDIKSTTDLPARGFTARQLTYTDGKKEVVLVVLKQHQQIFVIRIPQNSALVSDAITDIIDTIKVLH